MLNSKKKLSHTLQNSLCNTKKTKMTDETWKTNQYQKDVQSHVKSLNAGLITQHTPASRGKPDLHV